MAHLTLKCLLIAFFLTLFAFFYAAFVAENSQVVKWVLLVLDGIIGWSIKTVVSYLFPRHRNSN